MRIVEFFRSKRVPIRTCALTLACAVALIACDYAKAGAGTISSTQLEKQIRGGQTALILDVRSPEEYAEGHIPGAINMPHDQFPERASELDVSQSDPIIIYCHSGRRARLVEESLASEGYTKVIDLSGHMVGWRKAGLPIEK